MEASAGHGKALDAVVVEPPVPVRAAADGKYRTAIAYFYPGLLTFLRTGSRIRALKGDQIPMSFAIFNKWVDALMGTRSLRVCHVATRARGRRGSGG
jgi:hypothetical protein